MPRPGHSAALIVLCAALTLGACGADDVVPGEPTSIDVETPHERGREVAASSGCLGCHRIGEHGNTGPGQDLTRVGARMTRAEIARYLVHPEPPMPSYSRLAEREPADFDQLTRFLADLR